MGTAADGGPAAARPLHVVAVVKQVPRFESLELGPDGRLLREGLELELNPYCRRAVSQGVTLARASGGTCTVLTLGPPSAEDCLREAIAWGCDGGVLVSDPAFAGSDTLATSRALAAALRTLPPIDLVLLGRNSVDADTGQVPPQVAELLGLPFLGGVRELTVTDGPGLRLRCEHDDGFVVAEVALPAVLSCAERLCEPAKVDPAGRAAVDPARIVRLAAADLGAGPWGQAGSPTEVGEVRRLAVDRLRVRLDGDPAAQVRRAVALLEERGGLRRSAEEVPDPLPSPAATRGGPIVGVLVEPGRERATRELLGAAARCATALGGSVAAIGAGAIDATAAGAAGADTAVEIGGATLEADLAAAVAGWCEEAAPWAVLAPSTMWGREVAARVAARLGAGLVGDAVDLTVRGGRLVCWKPAFGGGLVAAVASRTPVQLVTVRPGVLPLPGPRLATARTIRREGGAPSSRVRILDRSRDDDVEVLATAAVVVTVGAGVQPDAYGDLQPLLDVLGAELAATRKVTDRGLLPRARQVGITGRAISPRLCVTVGASGKFNHVVGIRGAGLVLAINIDPAAPIFEAADIGLVADWRLVVPLLVAALAGRGPTTG